MILQFTFVSLLFGFHTTYPPTHLFEEPGFQWTRDDVYRWSKLHQCCTCRMTCSTGAIVLCTLYTYHIAASSYRPCCYLIAIVMPASLIWPLHIYVHVERCGCSTLFKRCVPGHTRLIRWYRGDSWLPTVGSRVNLASCANAVAPILTVTVMFCANPRCSSTRSTPRS